MQQARLYASMSKAQRLKVGAVLVTSTGIVIPGYNGTPKGLDNTCEDYEGKTKLSVIHAELNCILKCSREGVSSQGSVVYMTHSSCQSCAAMLISAGVKEVIYADLYRDISGIGLLHEGHVLTRHFKG